MVKRGRNQITQIEVPTIDSSVCCSDIWEERCVQRSHKKKRFTILDSHTTPQFSEYMDYKTALVSFSKIQGDESVVGASKVHFAMLNDGSFALIQRVKRIACPALFGGSNFCFLGRIFIKASNAKLDEKMNFFPATEVFETSYCNVLLENQIKKDVQLEFVDTQNSLGLHQPKNIFYCRYHYEPDTCCITPVLDAVNT